MGHIYAKVTLKNAGDVIKAKEGIITEPEIRQKTVQAMVDTGATFLVINEELFQKLGLHASGEKEICFANSAQALCKMTGPIEIHWENRSVSSSALVVEDAPEILLGVVPLEGLDLMVDPVSQKLTGAHGDRPMYLVY